MTTKKFINFIALYFFLYTPSVIGQNLDGLGQVIHIKTRLHSFVDRPSWLIIVRDIDNNQTLPYLYDITRGDNTWFAFTYGHHYLIQASEVQFSIYNSRANKFTKCKITNFCNLESNGHILRNLSMRITLEGDLSPYHNGYVCNVIHYPENIFYIVPSANSA